MLVRNTGRRRNVFNNQSGFTLLELLLAISVMLVIILVIPVILFSYQTFKNTMDTSKDYEWNLFILHLKRDLENVNHLTVFSNRIYIEYDELPNSNYYVEYEQYGGMIRRRVRSEGHEPALLRIEKMTFRREHAVLNLEVTFRNGIKDHANFLVGEDVFTE